MLNKRGGWKKFQKLINGEVPIRAWRVEKVSKINKRASLFIRQVRVAGGFHALRARISKNIYSESLKHALEPCLCLVYRLLNSI